MSCAVSVIQMINYVSSTSTAHCLRRQVVRAIAAVGFRMDLEEVVCERHTDKPMGMTSIMDG